MNNIVGSGGSSSSGGCFRAGSQVQLEHNKTMAIELLKVGDEVLAFDDLGQVHVSKVTKIHHHKEQQAIYKVSFWRGFTNITLNHWVLNQYNSFVEIGSLTENDALVDGMGHLRPITGIEYVACEGVYNLTVEPFHTFMCDGIRVHNGGHRERFPVPVVGSGGSSSSSKGKGSGGRAAVEDPDSLQSRALVAILDLLGEGEIGGLVDGARSIFFNDTPLQNVDGSYNYNGVTWDSRTGTQNQVPMNGFSEIETPYNEGVQVKTINPHTVTITNPNADQVRVIVAIPSLTFQDAASGDLRGTSVVYNLSVSTNNGPFVASPNITVTGKTRSRYQREHIVNLPKPGTTWQIRMTRITADSITSNITNDTYFDSFVEIVNTRMRYPNSALVAVRIDSEQFNQIPARSYLVNGLYIKVPSNYNAVTRAYTGIWDGTFILAVSNNPAWVMYDLLLNARYGLGEYITAAQVDKAKLYQIGRYCDELVSDGFNGFEPRFVINTAIQQQAEAYKLISDLSSTFRGISYWTGGQVGFTQDSPADTSMIYSPANVVDGVFSYTGSARKDRNSVVLVTWNDPAERYKQKIEYVEDASLVAQFGVRKTETVAFGCTSRGQANRVGKWILYTQKYESDLVTFTVGMDSALVLPGEIIRIHDPIRTGKRMAGRLKGIAANSATLDSPTTLALVQCQVSFRLPDGTFVDRVINETGGTFSTITWATPLVALPLPNSMWLIVEPTLAPLLARVLGISQDTENKENYNISAIEHNPSKFAAIESGLKLESLNTSVVKIDPTDAYDLKMFESLYLVAPNVVGGKVNLSWSGRDAYYEVRYRRAADNFTVLTTRSQSIDISPVIAGMYEFTVTSINAFGQRAKTVSLLTEVYGKTALPLDVAGFGANILDSIVSLTWSPSKDLDVIVGGSMRVKFSSDPVAPSWLSGVDIGINVPGAATSVLAPLMSGSYMVKWVDSTGNESANEKIVTVGNSIIQTLNFVATAIENPTFAGVKTNVVFDAGLNGLRLVNASLIGEYYFANSVDLGSVFPSRVSANLLAIGYDTASFIDQQGLIDSLSAIDFGAVSGASVNLYIRTTNDNPLAVSPTWTAWQKFLLGDFTARAYQFKIDQSVVTNTHNVLVKTLSVTVDMLDLVQEGSDLLSGAVTYAVVYSRPFKISPALSITAQNLNNGDYHVITAKSPTGFSITFKNSANVVISRTFDYIAKGY